MSLSTADANAVYKEYYGDALSDVTIFDSNSLLSSLKNSKLTTFGGRGAYVPIRTAPPPTVSGNLPTGTAGFDRLVLNSVTLGSSFKAFLIQHARLHGIATLSVDQILLSDDDKKAFVSLMVAERDGITQHVSKQLEQYLCDQAYGCVGRIAAISGAVITLEDGCDGTNFETGMELVAAADMATSAIRAVTTNGGFVSTVNYTSSTSANGNVATVTMTANVTNATDGISTAAVVGDLLFIRNSRDPAGTPVKSVTEGLGSWLPGTSTAHDTAFQGVTRTGNSRIRGLYVDGTQLSSITECIFYADQIATSNGGKLDMFWCSPRTMTLLQLELVGQIHYNEASVSKTAGLNFKAIEFIGQSGTVIRVAATRGMNDRRMYGLQSNTWSYRTIHQGVVAVMDEDGAGPWLRTPSDNLQLRVHSRGNLVCTAPGFSVRIDLDTSSIR